ncbi:MarR family transcriptional regulator [Lysinibacillus fusiformis]|uniref:MarR family transcriptional regulator n=1 Tax=Lysinibacillus fusiformis TaxID=28031 RepID=UPI00148B6892|nr:MarR family transcriptional regulator [Lysinibacillus fusiformis]NOG28369.1 MarR family transcriptional regulator [Lysinibacillus fusiformis]
MSLIVRIFDLLERLKIMQTIAILGSLFFWNNIKEHFAVFPHVQFIHFPYTHPEQCVDFIEEAASQSDIVLFAGSIPYYYCYEKIKALSIQATYLPFDELTLALSLLSLHHHERVGLSELSIDLPKMNSFYQVMKEAGIASTDVYVKDYAWVHEKPEKIANLNMADYVHYHKELYEAGKTKVALTSLHAVFIELEQLGIPAKYMVESKQTFAAAVTRALDAYHHQLLASSQIAVVSIHCQENLSHLHPVFLSTLETLSDRLHAKVMPAQQKPYLIISTRGVIEKLEPSYLRSLKEQYEQQFGTIFRVGVGYGYSLHEAEAHSSQALFFTTKYSETSTVMCLVDEQNRLYGPLFENNNKVALSSNNKHILEIAEKVKMSAKNINVMKQFMLVTNNRPFSAAELADYMNLSRRSAERIINRLIEQNYFTFAGEEHPYHQGRPRKLYKATTKWEI